MEQALQLPKLTLGFGPTQPKFLDCIDPPTYPLPSPPWSLHHKPRSIAVLDAYKDHELVETHVVHRKSMYLIGRNSAVCDIVLYHCSISRLHAAIVHHQEGSTYIIDLNSGHGTYLDGRKLNPLQPTLVTQGAHVKFGGSSRDYFFKTFQSKAEISETIQSRTGLDDAERALQKNTLLNQALAYRPELISPPTPFQTPANNPFRITTNDSDPFTTLPTHKKAESETQNPIFRTGVATNANHCFRPRLGRPKSSSADAALGYSHSFTLNNGSNQEQNATQVFLHDLERHSPELSKQLEPARKRTRGQSQTSQTSSSDVSLGRRDSSMSVNSESSVEENVDMQPPRKVHFCNDQPEVIPEKEDCIIEWLGNQELGTKAGEPMQDD